LNLGGPFKGQTQAAVRTFNAFHHPTVAFRIEKHILPGDVERDEGPDEFIEIEIERDVFKFRRRSGIWGWHRFL
jgi:hypothetical protein